VRSSVRVLLLAFCCWLVAAQAAHAQPESIQEPPDSDAVAATEPGPQTPTNWFEARLAIEALAEAGDFAAAAALGDLLIELVTEEFGPDSQELAEAYLLLAGAQKRNQDFTDAEDGILRAIEIFAGREGPGSPVLIDPFRELGANYNQAGDYTAAISAYGEARTIGRRNFGLLNQGQLEIIDDITAAAEQLGDIEEAQKLQLDAMTLVERIFGETSREAIDANYKYAAWLRSQRMYEDARGLYLRILRVVSRNYDDDPLMTVRALRERARSYRDEDSGDGLGISGLRDAIEVVEEMPDPPALLLAELNLEAGDWYVEFSRGGGSIGGDYYAAAWQLLGNLDNGTELRRQWFEELTVIERSPVSNRGLSSDPDAPQGYVEIRFTVDRAGRATGIEITDSFPAGLKDGAFMRQYRNARFRPRIENGQMVESRHALRLEFRYQPLDLADDAE